MLTYLPYIDLSAAIISYIKVDNDNLYNIIPTLHWKINTKLNYTVEVSKEKQQKS